MPLLTFFIYHRFTTHISMRGTAAVNILMSFLLYSLLCLYNMSMNDLIGGELLMIGLKAYP